MRADRDALLQPGAEQDAADRRDPDEQPLVDVDVAVGAVDAAATAAMITIAASEVPVASRSS